MQQHSVAKKSRHVRYTLQLSSKTKHQQPNSCNIRDVFVYLAGAAAAIRAAKTSNKSPVFCVNPQLRGHKIPLMVGRFFPSFIPQAVLVYSKTVWNPHKYCQRGKETQEKITRAVENSRLLRQTSLLRIYF